MIEHNNVDLPTSSDSEESEAWEGQAAAAMADKFGAGIDLLGEEEEDGDEEEEEELQSDSEYEVYSVSEYDESEDDGAEDDPEMAAAWEAAQAAGLSRGVFESEWEEQQLLKTE
jgi:hypothetical protein